MSNDGLKSYINVSKPTRNLLYGKQNVLSDKSKADLCLPNKKFVLRIVDTYIFFSIQYQFKI